MHGHGSQSGLTTAIVCSPAWRAWWGPGTQTHTGPGEALLTRVGWDALCTSLS